MNRLNGVYVSNEVMYAAIAAVTFLFLAARGLLKRVKVKDVEVDLESPDKPQIEKPTQMALEKPAEEKAKPPKLIAVEAD